MSKFLIPAATVQSETVIKKSRFVAFIAHAPSPQASHRFISDIREQHADARHVCWAFIAGEPGNTPHVSCSDDGEPAGTAGKPILNILQHSGMGEIVAVVVRYFGGVKLGTGGLVRAYGGAVAELIKAIPTQIKVDLVELKLTCPYPLEDVARRTLESCDAQIIQLDYQHAVQMHCRCPVAQQEALIQQLNDAGRGQIIIACNPIQSP